ncbi:HEPN domain-containing protein [Infirmifilum lucidum]|uniref:HEPN domain-containing protein n=1 Tax=Infirmifilum lucidum TaxID=2776706 RepID=A0A7L9FJS5_9CREN|nr:HEPN domain-containing protein [Infirmifilum lucidum]QOJ79136.1 HEPN domain-containing protein [Infirmifilum lucidum]
MSRLDEVRLLRKRARSFLNRAVDSFNAGDYDLSVFLSEQAVHLHVKSLLLERLGDYPRTHSMSLLAALLERAGLEDLASLLREKWREARLLEDAYIASRYLPREYSREEAEALLKFAEEVLAHG